MAYCDDDRVIGGVGISETADNAYVWVYFQDEREEVETKSGEEEKAGGFFKIEGKNVVEDIGNADGLGVHGNLVGGHAAEHAVTP